MNKIAIQGIENSFHHLAAEKFFGQNIDIQPCDSFQKTCELVCNHEADYAVMAIENSIAGCLLQNFFLLKDYKLKVIGEVYLHIQMNLMAYPGVKLEDIKVVQSHPIAIRQCAAYLNSLDQNLEWREKKDTAACAAEIMDQKLKNTAAIANEKAAKSFGLNILEKRIETNKQNFTRFFILSRENKDISQTNKATISFQIGHKIGSLGDVLKTFGDHQINLAMIQSIPIIGHPNEYLFNLDVEWTDRANYDQAMYKVMRQVVNLSILGEYKKATRPNIGI